MSKINDGGPAFPRTGGTVEGLNTDEWVPPADGMSLRDWFAGQVLAGMCQLPRMFWAAGTATDKERHLKFRPRYVETAYQLADAMLAERERKESS